VIDADADEGADVEPDLPRVHRGVVAGEDPRLLELADPLQHRGRRELHLRAEIRERSLAVVLQRPEERPVDVIEAGEVGGVHGPNE
jgi:hypothetical protein